jgi:hypothetical protein
MDIPIEIWQLCLSYAEFLVQIRLRCVCKLFHKKLEVHDFYNIDQKYLRELTDNILASYLFIKKLYAGFITTEITNVNHMTRLEILNVYDNNKISTVNHLTRLKVLNASGPVCRLADEGIKRLNLTELNASSNYRITNVNHMNQLKILNAGFFCGIDDVGISQLNLIKLDISGNGRITNINHMTNLEVLYAEEETCKIGNKGISNLSLKKLYVKNNPKITKKMIN